MAKRTTSNTATVLANADRGPETRAPDTGPMGDKYPVKMIPMSELRYASEAPPELGLHVRKVDPDQEEQLQASIRSVGIVYPLVTKVHEGVQYVAAGNRRLRALRAIHTENADTLVPTIDVASFKGTPVDIALASNEFVSMHPVDRYEAIAGMVAAGTDPVDVCQRFVLTDRQFRQITALGRLHEKVRAAWRAGEIDAAAAMAFTLAASPKEQAKVFDKLEKKSHDEGEAAIGAYSVREALAGGKQRDAYKLVLFVGVEAYEDAGGKLNRDLFNSQHDVLHPAIAKKLADEKIRAECARLIGAGWMWAEPFSDLPSEAVYQWRTVVPEKWNVTADQQGRMDWLVAFLDEDHPASQIEQVEGAAGELSRWRYDAAMATFDEKQRSKLGCGLKIDDFGNLEVKFGIVKPGEKPPADTSDRDRETSKKKTAAKAGDISNALAQRLSEALTFASMHVLMDDPKVALAALIAGFGTHGTNKVVSVREHGLASKRANKPAKAIEFSAHFLEWFAASPSEKAAALAGIAAAALDFQVFDTGHNPLKDRAVAAVLDNMNGKALNASIRKEFDAKDYFESVNKEVCLLAISEACGDEQAEALKSKSKNDVAAFAVKNVIKAGWLPEQLRTIHYDGPPKKKAKK